LAKVTEFLIEYKFVEIDESKKRIRLSKEAKEFIKQKATA